MFLKKTFMTYVVKYLKLIIAIDFELELDF